MRRFIASFFRLTNQERLPRLNAGLADSFDSADLDAETQLVLMLGRSRDPHAANQLLERFEADSAAELLPLLPVHRANWRERLANWIRHVEGSYPSNPHAGDREIQRTIGFD